MYRADTLNGEVVINKCYIDLLPVFVLKETSTFSDRVWFVRRPLQFLADIAILSTAFLVAYLPAINIQLGEYYLHTALNQLPFVVLVQFSALFLSGSYSILWRYISIEDLKVFLRAAIVSCVILVAFRFLLNITHFSVWQIPLSVIFIDTILGFGGILGIRVARRFAHEYGDKRAFFGVAKRTKKRPVLVIGAGRLGSALAKEMVGRGDSNLEIRGFVDDDPQKQRGSLSGIKVLGTTHDLARLVDEMDVDEVVIAIDQASGKVIRRILELCGNIPVKTQIVPSLNEIAQGSVSVNRVRDVQIEDLLGRAPVKIEDENLHEFLSGKTVMVTGAGGSIGSELIRQIVRFHPKSLLLVERAEFALFQIDREMVKRYPDISYKPLLADLNDRRRMRDIFELHRPQVIFHAAAHKHVPLMEANPVEAVKNNIFATRNLGELAGEFGVSDMVLISTDKAVNPTSIMGASKRAAEIVVQELDRLFDTNYISVRFGNVLGSAGSVVPIFREQIRLGEPITVTDAEMTRYFMTIPEAAQLVMQAGAIGKGGEIFVLDMGEPVKIIDLAEDMVRLSGLTPYEDIEIQITGMRPGEKLFEELEITGEDLVKTRHPKIFIGKISGYPAETVQKMIASFESAIDTGNTESLRQTFIEYIPEVIFGSSATAENTSVHSAKLKMASK